MTHDRLKALLTLASANDRICPVPQQWDQFWNLIGGTHGQLAPPLILAGWAFSSDRDKRDRFQMHIRYAAEHSLLDKAETFIASLSPDDWHTCGPSCLDWNYGDALADDMRKKEAALESAKRIHQDLLHLSNSPAFQKEHLAETLCLYHLLFKSGPDPQAGISSLREALDTYKHLGADCDVPLWHDAAPAVVDQITAISKSKQVEFLLLQLLSSVTACQQSSAFGRAEIDEFLDDMWS